MLGVGRVDRGQDGSCHSRDRVLASSSSASALRFFVSETMTERAREERWAVSHLGLDLSHGGHIHIYL